ncbi:hypothetical protein FB563_3935 [Streptomyces puniciscabiei]|uniref:Subtilisin inhibitor-like n=2 Tax=Streptomyces puniciscabiei TaxID=164348 RepID=A0A542UIJ7_9ACTN|nr:hypothetical protein [Streptomyces puniciscabiei]TQK98887.1 hypothetical protein FB563_3935 [Streptomyces puniciscabiei]
MRGKGVVTAVCLACLLPAALLSGCRSGAGTPVGDARPTPATTGGYGAQFLAVGECSSFGTTSFTEVPCTSERAAARVVARYDGASTDGPLCPATTDFVLHISARSASGDEDGDGAIPQGYACMRNLEPPHPGDPGGGGGPRTIPGDCVYTSGKGQVRETPCAGTGAHRPQYRITKAAAARGDCPASTALYVQLGGSEPVGCARRL